MLRFTIRFDRYTADNNDIVCAKDNFPKVVDHQRLLLEQLCCELRQNESLAGLWDIYHSQVINDNLFCVWVGFEWNETGPSFMTALQETYDVHGMSGFFEVLDVVGDGVDRKISAVEQTRKWIVQKIAGRLSGIHKDDLTTAERQIADLLVKDGHLMYDDQGNVTDNFRPQMQQ